MPNEGQNIEENNTSLSDFWSGFTENYNATSDHINFLGNRNRTNFNLRDTRRFLGKFDSRSNSILGGGLKWLETGDWKAGIVGGTSGYLTDEALQQSITAKVMGGHLQAGLARTSVGFLYGGAMYDMFYDIPAHAGDPTWKPSGFLADTPLFQLENYLVKKDKLAYKVYNDVQKQMLKDKFDYNNELLKKQWGDFKGKYIDTNLDKFRQFLNKDLSPSGTPFKASLTATDGPTGRTITEGQATGQAAKLSAENAYTHPDVNYDPKQRVLSQDGAVASPAKLDGGVSKTDLAASSAPANTNKFFKTPNGQAISKVLYSGINIGIGMLQGYLTSRMDQLLFGKEGAKKVAKVREGVSYYNTAKGMAKGIYENWGAITKGAKATWSAVKLGAQAAWQAVSSFAVHAVSWVVSAVSTAVSAMAGAIATAATVVAGAAAAVGGAIMSAIAWIAALALPW